MTCVTSPSSREPGTTWSPDQIWSKPFLRIGHGGAAGHAAANTIGSLALALEMGVDMVEFDVRPCRDALVLLHDDELTPFGGNRNLASQCTLADLQNLATGRDTQIATLQEALDLLKGRALINLDLKAAGYEDAAAELVRTKGMAGDVLFSSHDPSSLRHIRQVEAKAKTGLSYPEDRWGLSSRPSLRPVVKALLILARSTLRYRVLRLMTGAQANAVMLNHLVVSRAVVEAVHQKGGKVFIWTVDIRERIRELLVLGVDGIASNYPDLFDRPV